MLGPRAGQKVLSLQTLLHKKRRLPLELIQRLAALVPRPRLHLIRFHGVLAPEARLRPNIIPNVLINANTPKWTALRCPLPRRLPP